MTLGKSQNVHFLLYSHGCWQDSCLAGCWLGTLIPCHIGLSRQGKGLLTKQQLASPRVWSLRKGKRESKRRWAARKLQCLCNLISEVTSHDVCHLPFIRSKTLVSSPGSRGSDYTNVWKPESRNHLKLF